MRPKRVAAGKAGSVTLLPRCLGRCAASVRPGVIIALLFAHAVGGADDGAGHAASVAQVLNQADADFEARRFKDARIGYERAVALLEATGADSDDLAAVQTMVGATLNALGKPTRALPHYQEALAIRKRLFEGDHASVASSLNNLAYVLGDLGRIQEARPMYEEALAMRRRLFEGDHPDVAQALNNLAYAWGLLGKPQQALPLQEEALAMRRRLYDADHPLIASSVNNLAYTLAAVGEGERALSLYEDALGMYRRRYDGDHPDVAGTLMNVASTLDALGRSREALPLCEEALAMYQRLSGGDHPALAVCLNNLADTLLVLGRPQDALRHCEQALAMRQRMFDGDHPDIAQSLNNLASTLDSLGHYQEALRHYEQALHIQERLYKDDHPHVATCLSNVAYTLGALGEFHEALPLCERAVAINRRLYPGDHVHVARALHNQAAALGALGKHAQALGVYSEALSMRRRVYGGDHPAIAQTLSNIAGTLYAMGDPEKALVMYDRAIEMGERTAWSGVTMPRVGAGEVRLAVGDAAGAIDVLLPAASALEEARAAAATLGTSGRTRYMEGLRRWDPFSGLVRAHVASGDPAAALSVLERSRGRALLDLLAWGGNDPVAHARHAASASGDHAMVARIDQVQADVRRSESAVVVARDAVARARATGRRASVRQAVQEEVAARQAHQRALRLRLSVVRDSLPEGRPLDATQIRDLLAEDELLLAYALCDESLLFMVSRDSIRALPLQRAGRPLSAEEVAAAVDGFVELLGHRNNFTRASGKPHVGHVLFDMLVPAAVWKAVRNASRVYVLPHRSLHRLPFEALVVRAHGAELVHWAHEGPPVAYAASAAVLKWLRDKPQGRATDARVVAVGDPAFGEAPAWPAGGVVVTHVRSGTQAARAALRAGDVVTSYGGKETADFESLMAAVRAADPQAKTVSLTFEREGTAHSRALAPGPIGVHLAREPPPVAGPKLRAQPVGATAVRGFTRARALTRLPGTRAEVSAIRDVVRQARSGARVTALLGAHATEDAVFEAARAPQVLHLATHGLVDPRHAGRGSLALTPPRMPVPGNDGFLTVRDLLERWRG